MSESSVRKRGRRGSPESWSVDAHVGQRVRMRRTLLGMSQEKLGDAIGLTFQQVQKYERGSNRISAGTLYRLSQVLDVPVSYFFDSYDDPRAAASPRTGKAAGGGGEISRREARLLRLWRSAPSHIAEEMLALLSALSPHIHDGTDGIDIGVEGVDLVPTFPGRTVSRTTESMGKPAGVKTKRSSGPPGQKPRRRHGAVWDPADIYRATKSPAPSE